MLALGRAVRDEEAIFNIGLERLRAGARHGRFHAANVIIGPCAAAGQVIAVIKHLNGNGIGAGDEMPERQAVFIGLPFVQVNDLEFGEFGWPPKFENDRNGGPIIIGGGVGKPGEPGQKSWVIGPRRSGSAGSAGVVAGDVNDFWREPVGEIKDIDAGQRERDKNEQPVSFGHKIFE